MIYRRRETRIKIGVLVPIIMFPVFMFIIPGVIANEEIDFVVRRGEEITIRDQVFTPAGDIIVESGGKLILRDAVVIFNHTGCYDHGLILKENTTLHIHRSQIRGVNTLFFFRAQDTALIIEYSKIRMTHVLCGNTSRISIEHSDLWALHCFNESTVDVVNGRLHYIFLRGKSSAQVDDSHVVEVLLYDGSKASISDTTLKNVFFFDEGSATLSNCSYVDLVRFKPKLCDLTITVLDEETQELIPGANVTLERPRGSVIASSSTSEDGVATFHDLEEGDYFAKVEIGGYEDVDTRMSLLDEIQNETLIIRRIEKEKGRLPPTNQFLPSLMATVLTVIALYLFYRSHMRKGKKGTEVVFSC